MKRPVTGRATVYVSTQQLRRWPREEEQTPKKSDLSFDKVEMYSFSVRWTGDTLWTTISDVSNHPPLSIERLLCVVLGSPSP